jgi:hypothetical protein
VQADTEYDGIVRGLVPIGFRHRLLEGNCGTERVHGTRELDLGWVSMMYDVESWGPMRRRTMDWHPGPDFFIERYGSQSPLDLADVGWYRALAGYRLACITAYYFERHRSGKIDNPAWEVLGESVPFMFNRACALLRGKYAIA